MLQDKYWMPTKRGYRNPYKLELINHVLPIALTVFFLGLGFGYRWAMKAFGG